MLEKKDYFYIFSFPRSGNTWTVNSLKDYLKAQRAEVAPSVYGGDVIKLSDSIEVKFAGEYDKDHIAGVKSHMYRGEFVSKGMPANKILYVFRDPRDVMISYFFYLNKFLKKGTNEEKEFDNKLFSKHLKEHLPDLKNHMTGWLELYKGEVFPVQYEMLQQDYTGTLKGIKDFLNAESYMNEEDVKKKYKDNFSGADKHIENVLVGDNSSFYRKGIVGDWANYFTEEHKNITKNIAQNLLEKHGYEKDSNW